MLTYPNYGMNRPMYGSTAIRVRPVGSVEEVKASPIDFDGSIFYFHDIVNKKIYTKQINLDGMVQIDAYELAVPVQPTEEPAPEYVTKDELQAAMKQLTAQLKGENKDESVSTNNEFHF